MAQTVYIFINFKSIKAEEQLRPNTVTGTAVSVQIHRPQQNTTFHNHGEQ
jgi:hypothetical protein